MLYFFSGSVSQSSVYDTELEALFFLLKAYYSSKYRFHKLVVFLDSFNFVQHFNSCKIQSNGPMLNWAHSVKAVYIEKQHN